MPHGDDDTWTQTFSGRQFWPLDPREEDIDIIDIAHALAMKCRYTGHCSSFYSVGQHSVHVAEIVAWTNPELALTALLHDAAEAYIADVARPVKSSITQLAEIEHRLEVVVANRFGLVFPFPEIIKTADNIMLATERRDLMPNPPRPWKTYGVSPLSRVIVPWVWQQAKFEFIKMFSRLTDPAISPGEATTRALAAI